MNPTNSNKNDQKKSPLGRPKGTAGCEVWLPCEKPKDVESIALDASIQSGDLDDRIRAYTTEPDR